MNGFIINFPKLKGIHFRTQVKTGFDFAAIMEKLLYHKSIQFQYGLEEKKLIANHFVISTMDTQNVVFEIDLKTLEPGEITFSFEMVDMAKAGFELMHIMDLHHEVDVLDFVKYSRRKVETVDTELLTAIFGEEDVDSKVKMYINGTVLKIECYALADFAQDAERETENNIILFPKEYRPSALKSVILDETLSVPVHEKVFWEVLRKLEERHIPYEVTTVMNHIAGHEIEFESLSIRGLDFELVFNEQRLLHAYFGASVVDTSYFTTTKGARHNIGEIVRKELQDEKFVQVEGYGADDAWHYARDDSYEYVYMLGYNL